jgi:hypothetical protein
MNTIILAIIATYLTFMACSLGSISNTLCDILQELKNKNHGNN